MNLGWVCIVWPLFKSWLVLAVLGRVQAELQPLSQNIVTHLSERLWDSWRWSRCSTIHPHSIHWVARSCEVWQMIKIHILKQSSCSSLSSCLSVQLWECGIRTAIFPHFSFQYPDLQPSILRVNFLVFVSFLGKNIGSYPTLGQTRRAIVSIFNESRQGWTWKASCSSSKHCHLVNIF